MNFKNYLSNKTWDSPPHSPRTQHQTQDHEASIEDVLQNFYNKVFQIILQHRITHPNYTQTKNISGLQRRLSLNKRPNRWFSLELDDIDLYRNDTRPWRQAILREEVVPPLILEIYLDCSQLNSNQVTYLVDSGTKKFQLDLGKNNSNTYNAEATENDNLKDSILIEQWCLRLNKDRIDSNSDSISFYKQSIAFFKSFDTYIRLLPAYRLFNRLKSTKTKGLRVGYRFLYQTTNHSNEIGIDNIPKEYQNILECTQNHFQSLTTSQGTLELFLISRKKCDFFVEDGENYLSTCFQNDDQVQDDSRQQKPQQSSVNDRTASPLSYASNSTGSYPSISQQEPRIGSQGSTHSRVSNPSQNFATPTPIPSQRFNMPDAIPSQGSESSLTRFLANEKQVGSVGSFKASPPSYLTMHTRRSPSGNIGSPSLSSSPSSTHNQPSSFKSYSTDYKGSPHPMQFNIPRASPASGFRAESPLPSSKLSSSFGIKFPIINEYADSGYQKSSNSGKLIMGRESYESKPRHPRRGSGGSSYDLSTQEDDISELVKAIDNRKPLRLFGESSISVDLSRSQTMLDQFQNLQSDLCALNFTSSSKSQEPVNNVIAPEEPVLEDNDTITSPLKIPTPSQKHLFLAGSPLPSSFNVSRIHNEHGNSKSTSKSVPSDQLHHPRMRSNDTIPLTVTPDTQYEEERNQTIQDDNMLFDMSELNIS